MEKISAIPKPEIGVRILLSQEVGVKKHNEDFLILTVLFCLFMLWAHPIIIGGMHKS